MSADMQAAEANGEQGHTFYLSRCSGLQFQVTYWLRGRGAGRQ